MKGIIFLKNFNDQDTLVETTKQGLNCVNSDLNSLLYFVINLILKYEIIVLRNHWNFWSSQAILFQVFLYKESQQEER